MIGRCHNPKSTKYYLYGQKGIRVCDRWRQSFVSFFEDMGEVPEGSSIDRIDNEGDYEPSNCRWATVHEQANNRRNNRFIDYQGENMTVGQWAKRMDVDRRKLYEKVIRQGIPMKEAMRDLRCGK